MKVILTGPTGFIGAEVLLQLLASPSITTIIALSRRSLTQSSPKLQTIIHSDFTAYPPDILEQFKGASALIYAMGLARPNNDDPEAWKRVNVDYTLATAKMCRNELAPNVPGNGKFRFIYTSGHYVEQDQGKKLWFAGDGRKLRGRVELEVMEMAKGQGDLEVVVAKPSLVLAKDAWVKDMVLGGLGKKIRVDQLAGALIEVAERGYDRGQVCGNDELVRVGDVAIKRRKT